MPVKRKIHHLNSSPDLNSLVRHHSSSSDDSFDPAYFPLNTPSPSKSSKRQLRHYHQNARRTKIHLILNRKILDCNLPVKRRKRVSYFLMSEEYKRKMSNGHQQSTDLEPKQCRKISWGDESQFVLFNKNKSCQAIKKAPRHKFSIDE